MAERATSSKSSRLRRAFVLGALTALLAGCGAAQKVGDGSDWPPLAKRWYDRAVASLRLADVDDAQLAAENALRVDGKRDEVRLIAAKVALTRLDFARAIELTDGLETAEASGIRGRALWYSGRITEAADALERLVADPDVHDSWAVDIAKLARRGAGRKPFTIQGGLLAVTEMPRVGRGLLVPIELDGEPALAMIATSVPEVVVDASGGAEPKWVSLRFGERLEVRDVPALTKDLSSLSRQLNAPVKALLGVNLLRRLRPTFDLIGAQFIVRSYEPQPAPGTTILPLAYAKGGGMLTRCHFGPADSGAAGALMVDTMMDFPLALDEGGWKKAGVALKDLHPIPGNKNFTHGVVPHLALGSLELPSIPAVHGQPIADVEKVIDMDLDGIIGSSLLGQFRITLVDGGRSLWIDALPMAPEAEPVPSEPPPAASPAPAASAAPPVAAPGKAAKPKPAAAPASKSPAGNARP